MKKGLTDSKKYKRIFNELKQLYKDIPATEGCMKNIKSCKAVCCRLQNPQILNCEFLYIWTHIQSKWSYDDILSVFEKSLRNYLSNEFNKSCIFWDQETKFCQLHERRPFNCRLYGITPDNEIKPRIAKLRQATASNPFAQIKDQCDLVSTCNKEKITSSQTNAWWKRLRAIEKKLGIKYKDMHDEFGGTYRTYHDYILMFFINEEKLEKLSALRQYGEHHEKEAFIKEYMAIIKKGIPDE